MKTLDINKPVKYLYPSKNEENLIFKIVNYNEITDRVIMEVQNLKNWGPSLKPTFLESIDNLTNI